MKITNISNLNDGFGECFKFLLYTIFYCEFMKHDFYYTPAFTNSINHNYNNDIDYIKKKEEMIDFENNFKIATDDCIELSKFQYISFFEKNIHLYDHSLEIKKIKKIFKAKNKNRFDTNKKNIAIHIRKNNQYDKKNIKYYKEQPGLDVPNEVYKEIIFKLSDIYKNSLIHIYSQGDINDFNFINDKNIIFHLNDTVENTFTDFVYADILLISPSAFSYTAGLISDGIIYYLKHCHRPLNHWNIIEGYTSTRDRYTFFLPKYIPVKMIHYDVDNEIFYSEENGTIKEFKFF